jgi:glycosyltransferase involved in cell wall biosynthesis
VRKPNFSICVVAKNEAQCMGKFMEALQPFVLAGGDVVVVDTGSTDGTPTIARLGGAKVTEVGDRFMLTISPKLAREINEEYIVDGEEPIIYGGLKLFNYGEARNFAASLAENDEIFVIDPDEIVINMDINTICRYIDEGAAKISIWWNDYRVNVPYYFDARWYNRKQAKWVGAMHEDIVTPGKVEITVAPKEVLFVEHRPVGNPNRANYLAGMAHSLYLDQSRERQTHWFARELMFGKRYKSAIRLFVKHVQMGVDLRWD